MNLKRNLLATAVALSFIGSAHAAIQPTELFFFASNGSTDSVTFDLGINMANFAPTAASSVTDGTKIVWDFDASTVTINSGNTLSPIAVNYGTSFQGPFVFGPTTTWGVIGMDETLADIVSTSAATSVTATGGALTEASAQVQLSYVNALNANGTHATSGNGGAFSGPGVNPSILHFNQFGATNQWRNNVPFSAALAGEGSMPFYYLAYDLNGDNFAPAIRTTYAGNFSYDAASAQLTYEVAPIPEPSTYALLGAGLVMLGAIARRRMNG